VPDKASGGFSEGLIEATEGEKVTVQIIGETIQYSYIHLSFLEKVTYIIRELAMLFYYYYCYVHTYIYITLFQQKY
jgi:hypothetical protein